MNFVFVNLIVACTISQGSKGTYETLMPAIAYDDKYYFTQTDGSLLIENPDPDKLYVKAIEKEKCRIFLRRPDK